jgi:hypothetical protein
MKSKIDSLISQQVDNGTLTADQAKELQAVFAAGPAPGAEGAGGPPPPPAATNSGSADTASATSSSAEFRQRQFQL